VKASDAPPIDALGGLPGSHLGLTWQPVDVDGMESLERLVRRCEDSDSALVRTPAAVLTRVFQPRTSTQVAMVGLDARGEVRACASVRAADRRDAVALRASIDPTWRGRGIGRAVLAWQDRWSLAFLGAASGPAVIGAPIPSQLIDRRRLYTAAGFSCHARVEILGSGVPVDGPAGHTLGIRPLAHDDRAAVEGLAARAGHEPLGFIANALTVGELLETSDLQSFGAEMDGRLTAAVLGRRGMTAGNEPIVHLHTLLLEPGTPVEVAARLVGELLGVAAREGVRALASVAPASMPWRDALAAAGFAPVAVDLLYTIEQP